MASLADAEPVESLEELLKHTITLRKIPESNPDTIYNLIISEPEEEDSNES